MISVCICVTPEALKLNEADDSSTFRQVLKTRIYTSSYLCGFVDHFIILLDAVAAVKPL